MENNVLVSRGQCPRCKAKGNDTSADNLAVYSDGHEWCYACQFYKPANVETRIAKLVEPIRSVNKAPGIITLPEDAVPTFPVEVLSRLFSWGISPQQLVKHRFKWSPGTKRIIMPVYDGYGQLLMYQSRSLDIGQQKYLTVGQSSDILHIIPSPKNTKDVIILCEDLVSAIRISEFENGMPLWGNDIPLKTIQRLATQFLVVGVWLDPDMKLKAIKDVLRISQYIPAFFIDSKLDPKFYELDRIKEHIKIGGYSQVYKDKQNGVK